MNDTCSSCRTAPDTAGWLIRNDSASSADVIVPVGLTSIRPITRADIVGTPLSASTPANRSTNWLISSGVGSVGPGSVGPGSVGMAAPYPNY
jgi:hypothetical protein